LRTADCDFCQFEPKANFKRLIKNRRNLGGKNVMIKSMGGRGQKDSWIERSELGLQNRTQIGRKRNQKKGGKGTIAGGTGLQGDSLFGWAANKILVSGRNIKEGKSQGNEGESTGQAQETSPTAHLTYDKRENYYRQEGTERRG